MAKKNASSNGRSNLLEEAMALLIQSQASFRKDLRDIDRERHEIERTAAIANAPLPNASRESKPQWPPYFVSWTSMVGVLAEHSRLLERLPDAVRDKIGFKGRQ